MFAKALLAFLALPGVVAFGVPVYWLLTTSHTLITQPLGLDLLVVGCELLSYLSRLLRSRQGDDCTLDASAQQARLVVVGLYRYTRNPMYIAVTVILLELGSVVRVDGTVRVRDRCGCRLPSARCLRRRALARAYSWGSVARVCPSCSTLAMVVHASN